MAIFHKSDDFEPMGWIRGYPVYATTLLVAAHVVAFAACCLVMAIKGVWLLPLIFSSGAVLGNFAVWQLVTYPWVHIVMDSWDPINFLIEMWVLYSCGREVERYIGRSKFLLLYLLLTVSAPLVLTPLGFLFPSMLRGSISLHFALIVAFATLYPSVQFWFNIAAKWLAAILLAVYTLFFIAHNDLSNLCAMWVDSAVAWYFISWVRGSLPGLSFGFGRRSSSEGEVRTERQSSPARPTPPRRREKIVAAQDDPMAEIDPLLEKIAQHGMASLTAQERAKLQKARQDLLKKH